MRRRLIDNIVCSLRWNDWLSIICSFIFIYIFNSFVIKWLRNEYEQKYPKNQTDTDNTHFKREAFAKSMKFNNTSLKKIRNEELAEKQKNNAKLARQQKREAFELKERLKEIKQEIYEKKINEKIIERLLENKRVFMQEKNEYEKWKSKIEICESGREFEYDKLECEYKDLMDFINTVVSRKVTDINELSAEFQIKVEEVISRIHQLEEQEIIEGLLTEKGQYIYINESEWEYISANIDKYGKMTKSKDLTTICNRAINLSNQPTNQLLARNNQKNC
ncbi:DDRGK domain protein [Cryptosporidium felis]|nr:DDRGK domain protein [Cryptosporidium felis]